MKKNIVVISGLLMILLAAGTIFHGLYVRLSTSQSEQESAVKVRELARPAAENHGETAMKVSSEEKLHTDIATLTQQVSVLAQNMTTLQDQFQVLLAGIHTEGTEKDRQEAPESGVVQEDHRDESTIEQPDMHYTNETRDDQWASPTEAAIAAEFTTNPEVAGVTIDTIDCRSSLCRIVWQYKPDMTSEEAFATENEMLAAMNRAGFNASSQSTLGGGSNEGYFWYNPPPPQENLPGENKPSALLGGGR